MLCLQLALTLVDHLRRNSAQKEAEEKKAALAPFVGVWEAKSISDPKKGEIIVCLLNNTDYYLAAYGYDFSDDGTDYSSVLVLRSLYLDWADADGKITTHPCWQRRKLYSNRWFLRPDDHWGLWFVLGSATK